MGALGLTIPRKVTKRALQAWKNGRYGETAHVLEPFRYESPTIAALWAECMLALGNWSRPIWDAYEARLELFHPYDQAFATWFDQVKRTMPRWRRGQGINGARIFVLQDGGVGDCVQMMRYIPLLEAMGAHVIFRMPTDLATALDMPCVSREWETADCYVPLLSLPGMFESTPFTVPSPLRTGMLRERGSFTERPHKIGYSWRGNASNPNDRYRSMKEPPVLDRMPGEWTALPESGSWSDTIKILRELDLIVTVDTGIAHVAATMGKIVYILLAKGHDWRWLVGHRTTPWYPHVLLFEQPRAGAWGPVWSQIREALA